MQNLHFRIFGPPAPFFAILFTRWLVGLEVVLSEHIEDHIKKEGDKDADRKHNRSVFGGGILRCRAKGLLLRGVALNLLVELFDRVVQAAHTVRAAHGHLRLDVTKILGLTDEGGQKTVTGNARVVELRTAVLAANFKSSSHSS